MKKVFPNQQIEEEQGMLPEYDFRGGVRGKHSKDYMQGHTVKIHQEDGTTIVQHYTLQDGAVVLEPDVREFFPDSQAVNQALRSLIALMAELPDMSKKKQTSRKKPKPAASSQKEIVKPG